MVIDEAVAAAGALGKPVHHLLHYTGHPGVEGIHGLAGLEVDVRVLRGAADERMLRRQRPGAMGTYQIGGHQRSQILIAEHLDGVQLVRGPEAVEEVHERYPGGQRRRVRHQRKIVGLLHRCRRQQRKSGLPSGHHVGVVAEDGQPLSREGTSRHVHYRAGQLARDLVHVRNHQQQTLRGGEGCGQRAALQCTVQRTRRATLALHLHDGGDRAPNVRTPTAGPFIGQFGHRRGRCDRVNTTQFAEPVRDRRRRLIAVDRYAGHSRSPTISMGATKASMGSGAPSGIISMECTGHCSKHARQPVQRS